MKTITLSIPMSLKVRMSKHPELKWSEVSREELRDRMTKFLIIKEISEIPEDDTREINDELAKDVVRSVEETIKSGVKPMTIKEFKKWSDSL